LSLAWSSAVSPEAHGSATRSSRLDPRAAGSHMLAMATPFVTPEEPTAAEAIQAISDELQVFDDWMDRYQFIIELGRNLPPFPQEWMDDQHRVPGCQSKGWREAA